MSIELVLSELQIAPATTGRSIADAARFLELAEKATLCDKGRGPSLAPEELATMNSYRDWVLTSGT
jgi:hypothetical protein